MTRFLYSTPHTSIKRSFLAFTAMKGKDTMSSVAVSVRGKVRELGYDKIPELFNKNPYMREIYPTEESMKALTVFQIYEGSGEWFDLSKKPIERDSFAFGGGKKQQEGFLICKRKRLKKYDDINNEMHFLAEVQTFAYGVRLGLRMMSEAGGKLTTE